MNRGGRRGRSSDAAPAPAPARGVVRAAPGEDEFAVPDHLRCCVCLEPPWGQIEQCSRGHIFCAEAGPEAGDACANRIRKSAGAYTAKCPLCRVNLPSATDAIRGRALRHVLTVSILAASWKQRESCSYYRVVTCRWSLVISGVLKWFLYAHARSPPGFLVQVSTIVRASCFDATPRARGGAEHRRAAVDLPALQASQPAFARNDLCQGKGK